MNRGVLAVYADSTDPEDPLAGLVVGERPEPEPPEGWVSVEVRAAALNHHDVWSLRGVGLPRDRLPMTLGCDCAGVDPEGNPVVVHAVITSEGWRDDETLDPRRTLLSERHQGTLAERVMVPRANLVPKPPELSFEQAACLPTAWLTAYRMLFVRGGVTPGQTILVQGSSGGVATALIRLAASAGVRVWATGRTEEKRALARALGAEAAFEPGARLPERVDRVMETTGAATWSHSLKALKPGGTVVISGATSGAGPAAELNRIFFLQLSVIGSTMGTREELARLMRMLVQRGIEPEIGQILPLSEARTGFAAMLEGRTAGKIVFTLG
ncbi:MAG TPA: zinc-binding dehydrogenase [Solirubrobacteraceae bacterium]|nr:zinc-binding dehydrogenase [Solirubrobacteraceae bacterium]